MGLCLLVLGWTAEIVECFVTEPKLVRDHLSDVMVDETIMAMNEQKRSCTITLAVLSIYAVDFAINAGRYDARPK